MATGCAREEAEMERKVRTFRFSVNPEVTKTADEAGREAENQKPHGYVPLLRVPNVFRRLYNYSVYMRERSGAF